jgi:hypothetical protein
MADYTVTVTATLTGTADDTVLENLLSLIGGSAVARVGEDLSVTTDVEGPDPIAALSAAVTLFQTFATNLEIPVGRIVESAVVEQGRAARRVAEILEPVAGADSFAGDQRRRRENRIEEMLKRSREQF